MKINFNSFTSNSKGAELFRQKTNAKSTNFNALQQNPCERTNTLPPAYFHPSFQGKNPKNQLSKFLDYIIANPNDINGKLKKAKHIDFKRIFESMITPENCIGKGHADMYRISDKYCFKKHRSLDLRVGDVNVIKKPLFNNLKKWYKAEVMIGNITIFRNANPDGKVICAGVSNNPILTSEMKRIYNETYLPRCENIPQEAFDDLALDFKTLNKVQNHPDFPQKSYAFDTVNPNNFLLTSDSIRIVDDIELEDGQNINNLASMLNVFLLKYNYHNKVGYADETLLEPRKKILKKCLLACEKAEIPLPEDQSNIKFSFSLAGLPNKWQLIEKKINELQGEIPNIEKRITLLDEYFDSL